MISGGRLQLAFAAALAAAAVVGTTRPFFRLDVDALALGGFLVLGLVSVFVDVPKGLLLRGVNYLCAFAGALRPHGALVWVALLWTIWPIAIMVAVGLDRLRLGRPNNDVDAAADSSRVVVAAAIGAIAIASVAYHLIVLHNLQQTAALFIGIPALIAIVVVLFVSTRSASDVALKAVGVGLLVSMLLMWEGVLCVLMAAPLFLLVALVIGWTVYFARDRQQKPTALSIIILIVAPMSLEGVTPATTINRAQVASETKIVAASPDAIGCALFGSPRFDRALPT